MRARKDCLHANDSSLQLCVRCAVLVALLTAGCGKPSVAGRVAVVPVTGKVLFQGQPTPGALVAFHPLQGAQSTAPPAQATVRQDGTFVLTTYTANDGVPAGEYKVTVEWRKLIDDNGDTRPGPNLLPDRYRRRQVDRPGRPGGGRFQPESHARDQALMGNLR